MAFRVLLLALVSACLPGAPAVAGEPAERRIVEIGSEDPAVTSLRIGARRAPVLDVRYRETLDPDSLRVFLGDRNVTALFNPRTLLEEQVMLPLSGGENVLLLQGVLWAVDEPSGRHVSRRFEQKLVIHRVIEASAQASFKAAERPVKASDKWKGRKRVISDQ